MFTWTAFDRLKYGLSRLSYGLATWRGLDARKLASESAASGRTAAVIACRFPPGFGAGPRAAPEWRKVSVTLGDTTRRFHTGGHRQPYLVEVDSGTHRLSVAHDGPPPTYETTIDVVAGQTLLIEVLPASEWGWKQIRHARLRIRSGDDDVVLEANP